MMNDNLCIKEHDLGALPNNFSKAIVKIFVNNYLLHKQIFFGKIEHDMIFKIVEVIVIV